MIQRTITREKRALYHYWLLIRKCIARTKTEWKKIPFREVHHIIPKQFKVREDDVNVNANWNKVWMSPREHVLAHQLLYYAGVQIIPTFDLKKTCTQNAAIRVFGTKKSFTDVFTEKSSRHANMFYSYLLANDCPKHTAKGLIQKLVVENLLHGDKIKLDILRKW